MIDLLSLDTDGKVNSGYGKRAAPTSGASTNHKGIDVTLKTDNIPAVVGGTVTANTYSSGGGYMLTIAANDGTTQTYMHMASKSPLSVGTVVTEGQTIGTQGSTGESTGKHLHYQVEKDGVFINPLSYLSGASGTIASDVTAYTTTTEADSTGIIASIGGKLIEFIAIILIAVAAAYLFLKAFDIKIFKI